MKTRLTEEQIIQILREADVTGHNLDVCREHSISEQTFSHWRRRYPGLRVSALQRLKRLESANAKLKRLVAEQALTLHHGQELLPRKGLL